ncbi:MAG: roadblock/LC7 domain-containing protein [Acidobacteria bacterium]|nr:roadblock/LC7 domain-containing protein [Acidobacteriota bacterium]
MVVNLNTLNLHEPEFKRIKSILENVQKELRAEIVLLISQSGQPIVIMESEEKFDTMSLASLAAANLAATDSLANLVGEGEFSVIVHQGKNRSLYISDVLRKFSLVLVFSAGTTLGLVRYKAKKAVILLEEVIQDVLQRSDANTPDAGNPDFSEEELEKLLEL